MVRNLSLFVLLLALPQVALAQAPAGGAPAALPAPKPEEKPKLPFNKATVGDVIQAHLKEIQGCYEEAMAAHGSTGKNAPGGNVVMAWTITTEGLCTEIKVKKSQIKDDQVTDCITTAINAWEFPQPDQRTPMEVPFALKPSTGVERKDGDAPAKEPAKEPAGKGGKAGKSGKR